MLHDGRHVERLIADAVAVAAAVEDGDEGEDEGAGRERRPFGGDQRATILLDQMAVVTTDRRLRAVVPV